MKLNDAKTSEFLTQWAETGKYLEDGLDDILHYANGRIDSLPAPVTLESCIAMTDDEQMAMFEQFGLAKYYPDISHERRAWMLWMQNLLWRKLGTPKALETLCMYLFDDVTVHLEVKDNGAWDSLGNLIHEDLLDVFDAELTIDSLNLSSEMLERVKANIIRFVRNQEWMRTFVFLFEAMDTTTGVSITDGERYARDYLIDLRVVGQYGFFFGFEVWEPSNSYDIRYNFTKDGLTINAVGMVIGSNNSNYSPISGNRSFMLNGGMSFSSRIIISGLHGVGTISMKAAPCRDGNGDIGATLLVLVGDELEPRSFPIPPDGTVQTLSIEVNNPLVESITILSKRPTQTTQRSARIRIDDIEF